ncbi:hypothetical protein J2T17_004597 [Paenibacillus mucilaginosus]|uniref:hypothetical protein n=1 Tax=Paenibacillus mucilaginosus TaxID=61624 RepID=UPI003D25794A
MKAGAAKAAAVRWVAGQASRIEGFRGAYFSGSILGLSDEDELPAASDVDVVVVTEQAEPPVKPGKFLFEGALIEGTYLSAGQLSSAEQVLGSYHLAGSFRRDTIISDPSGELRRLQQEVAAHFAERTWVSRRCGEARGRIESWLQGLDPSAPPHDRFTSWLFATGVTTHVLLVAALRNPTVRLRYLAARDVLTACGREDIYGQLLELLGCVGWSPERTRGHLRELARTFDAAAAAGRTPFFFSSDISPVSRPIAIDGSEELIRSGNHREAVFWIAATFARCRKILAADAPELEERLAPAFHALTEDLGVADWSAMSRRAEEVLGFLPVLWDTAEAIMTAHPDIVEK